MRPHRGTMILVFGIVSFVLICFPLGIAAWVMGQSDLKAMQRGEMDRAGEVTTQVGKILGIISVLLWALGAFAAICISSFATS